MPSWAAAISQGDASRTGRSCGSFFSKLACVMAWPLTPVRDATSGFFLIRRQVLEGVTIAAGGFKICLELLTRSPVRSVAEVPVRVHRPNDRQEQDDTA